MEGVLTKTILKLEPFGIIECNRILTIFHTFIVRATSTRKLIILKCPSLLTNRKTCYAYTSYEHI